MCLEKKQEGRDTNTINRSFWVEKEVASTQWNSQGAQADPHTPLSPILFILSGEIFSKTKIKQ